MTLPSCADGWLSACHVCSGAAGDENTTTLSGHFGAVSSMGIGARAGEHGDDDDDEEGRVCQTRLKSIKGFAACGRGTHAPCTAPRGTTVHGECAPRC